MSGDINQARSTTSSAWSHNSWMLTSATFMGTVSYHVAVKAGDK